MYNNETGAKHGLKAHIYGELVDLVSREDSLEIIVERARNIEKESAKWNLSQDERRTLYKKVAHALDRQSDIGTFKVLHAYLKTY